MHQFFHALEARRLLSDNALRFDGVNDFVDFGNPADHHLDLGENGTIEMKVNFKALPAFGSRATFISKGTASSSWFFGYSRRSVEGFDVSGTELEIVTSQGMTTGGGGWIPELNHWYHIALVKTGQNYVEYIDGVPQGNEFSNLNPPAADAPLRIGTSHDGQDPFNGMIDEVRVWGIARTAAEINANRNKTLTGAESNLAGYWDFNEALESQSALDRTSHHSDGRLGTTTGVDTSDPVRVILSGGGDGGGSIAGMLFNDGNKNGLFDAGESLLAGKKMYIDSNSNGKFDSGEAGATTNASGGYSFSGLAAGTYRIGRADTPAGYSFSTPAGGIWTVTLVVNQAATGKNFGVFQGTGGGGGNSASISGTLFNDGNKNGVFNAGESLLAGKKIYIDANSNGKFDVGEKTTLTNAGGVYSFTGLAAGTYRVGRADTPAGYSFSTPVGGIWVVPLASAQAATGKNFGVFQGPGGGGGNTGSISGTVFSDADKDGVLDAAETRLAGKKIYLDKNRNGVLDAGDISLLANAAGLYTFTGLAAGTYRIRRADLPPGYKLSVPSTGFYEITISAGQAVTGKNIGAVPV
jgi:hypothetical protein